MSDRIQQLIQYVREEPHDPFNVYALAVEYQRTQPDQARQYFDQLLNQFPDYLPTYYQAAALYAQLNQTERAMEIYQMGVALARAQNNPKTLRELEQARRTLEEDGEEW